MPHIGQSLPHLLAAYVKPQHATTRPNLDFESDFYESDFHARKCQTQDVYDITETVRFAFLDWEGCNPAMIIQTLFPNYAISVRI